MKLSYALVVSAALLFSAQLLYADSIYGPASTARSTGSRGPIWALAYAPNDPQLIIARGRADQTSITTLSPLSEQVDPNGGGLFGFVNDTGLDITGLTITIDFENAKLAKEFAANCTSSGDGMADILFQNIFSNCTVNRHGTVLTVILSGGEGIANGSDFFIDLNDGATTAPGNHGNDNDPGGWLKNSEFEITPQTTTPEPGTLALLGSGLAGLCLRRKRKSKK